MARLAVDGNEAIVLPDDTEDRGEAQPGPLAHFLGGKERLEQAAPRFCVRATAVVTYRQQGVVAGNEGRVQGTEPIVEPGVAGFDGELADECNGKRNVRFGAERGVHWLFQPQHVQELHACSFGHGSTEDRDTGHFSSLIVNATAISPAKSRGEPQGWADGPHSWMRMGQSLAEAETEAEA